MSASQHRLRAQCAAVSMQQRPCSERLAGYALAPDCEHLARANISGHDSTPHNMPMPQAMGDKGAHCMGSASQGP